jgi:hypothetical protein
MSNDTVHLPTRLEALIHILQVTSQGGGPFYICHGKGYCEHVDRDIKDFEPCEWCHKVVNWDKRTAEQIEAAIVAQQMGH